MMTLADFLTVYDGEKKSDVSPYTRFGISRSEKLFMRDIFTDLGSDATHFGGCCWMELEMAVRVWLYLDLKSPDVVPLFGGLCELP